MSLSCFSCPYMQVAGDALLWVLFLYELAMHCILLAHPQSDTSDPQDVASMQVSIALNVDIDGGRSSEWDSF